MSEGTRVKDGKTAENQAARMLRDKGLKILQRNYNTPRGEIDIIADDQGTLVFTEVRLRTHASFGGPKESINRRKQQSISRAAQYYLASEKYANQPCRFDAICFSPAENKSGTYTMEWLRDAFRPGE